jgi:hypothetical protein
MFFFSSGLFNGSAREKPQRDAAEASLHDQMRAIALCSKLRLPARPPTERARRRAKI